jgi:hypothetical protein
MVCKEVTGRKCRGKTARSEEMPLPFEYFIPLDFTAQG